MMLDCVVCNGKGCKECDNHGKYYITTCPLLMVDRDTWDTVEMIRMYIKHGLPPVAGGQLDQAKQFMDAVQFVSSEEAGWQAQLGMTDG